MATYKVIQDIEAEDKLLGPLTLRQFIYAVIVIALGFIAFKLATINSFLVIPFLIPMGFFGLLAAPFGHDQSSEVWMLAKIRFHLKPRRRIWDQSGLQELVTITVPKKIEKYLTDGLSPVEVKSRLQALANTIDSRGWAVKNVNVNLSAQQAYASAMSSDSDRLLDVSSFPQEVPTYDIYASDDMMDETNNPTAQHLNSMIDKSGQAHRQAALSTIQSTPTQTGQTPADYWFMHQPEPTAVQPGYATFTPAPTVLPGMPTTPVNQASDDSASDKALLQQIHKNQSATDSNLGHSRVVSPLKGNNPTQKTPSNDPATIARLASSNDLNVSTIAREAGKANKSSDGEVTINLR